MPAPPRFGSEFVVSTQNSNSQDAASIARSVDGRMIVAWQDAGTNAGDIKFRLLSASGTPITEELTANASTASEQAEPDVAFLADGKFVIVWTDFGAAGGDVRYRVFNADGTPAMVTDGIVSGASSGIQQQPAVTARDDGSFVIAWYEGNAANIGTLSGGSASAVLAESFNASGVSLAAPVRISGNWGGDFAPAIAASGTDIVIGWDDSGGPQNGENGNDGIYFRTISGALPTSAGVNGGTRADTNAGFRDSGAWPSLAIGNLGTLLVWQDFAIPGADSIDVYARLISPNGTLQPVFKVNTTTLSDQRFPSVTALPQGGYVVVWESFVTATSYDIMARIIDPVGVPQDEFLVTSGAFTTGSQLRPDVVALLDGRFMVTWGTGTDGSRGIEAQIFDPRTAAVVWFGADDPLGNPSGPGEQYWGTDLAGFGDNLNGGFGNDTVYGQSGPDTISGGAYNDSIEGGNGNDVLFGDYDFIDNANFFSGNDTIRGGDGNDTLTGGFGANDLDGGIGTDTARYDLEYLFAFDTPPQGLSVQGTINLTTERATVRLSGADAFGDPFDVIVVNDTITGVESAIGTFGADSITGNTLANGLTGGAGNDTLDGVAGNDFLTGGTGNDSLIGGADFDYANYLDTSTTAGITLSLAVTTAQNTGGAGTDTLTSIEGIYGSNFGDTLTGDNAAVNALYGWGGADSLSGAGGFDYVEAGEGDDTMDGGAGDDYLLGGNGVDTLTYASAGAAVYVDMSGASAFANGTASGFDVLSGIERVIGSGFGDFLFGSAGADTLTGGVGIDIIYGFGLGDSLDGGADTDYLVGGAGADTITTGAGQDYIYFQGQTEGKDTITDWRANGFDILCIDEPTFGGGLTINQYLSDAGNANRFVVGTAATAAIGQFLWNSATSTLSWDADGTGGGAAVQLVTLTGITSLTAADILVL